MQPLKYLDEMLPWNDRLQMLQCISAIEEAPDVMTFSFKTLEDNWFRYTPGQFVTLELPIERADGLGPVLRTYTLSSTPSRPYHISVTVKAQKDSIGTRWMLDHLRPPMTIKAYGPNGDFSLANHPSEKYLFISAGSGITPMVSMTRWLFDCAPATDVAFINCARSPDDIIFRKELELLSPHGSHAPCIHRRAIIRPPCLARPAWTYRPCPARTAGAGFSASQSFLLRS